MSLLSTIRKHCLDCSGGSPIEVRECRSEKTCKLWPYRMGTRPQNEKRVLSEGHLKALKAGRDRSAKTESGEEKRL